MTSQSSYQEGVPFESDEGIWLIVRHGYVCGATEAEVDMARRLTIDDEMVSRAATAIHAAYQPDEGDNSDEVWRAAVRAGLLAALEGLT